MVEFLADLNEEIKFWGDNVQFSGMEIDDPLLQLGWDTFTKMMKKKICSTRPADDLPVRVLR